MGRGKGRDRKRTRRAKLASQRQTPSRQPAYKDEMGIFSEYVKKRVPIEQLDVTRRAQLARIGKIRNSAVISYAAKISQLPPNVDINVTYDDILPLTDLLDGKKGERITVLLETPGGYGEVGRDLVEILHERYAHVTFIVPGMAKSTGTIMCLGGHEIMMGPGSSLGPIDAQLFQDGKRFSADAFLEGFNRIKEDIAANNGQLNPAYIPILQRISPGELQNAMNALEFARATVSDWLVKYKFANWEKNGVAVSDDLKKERAREIADNLAKQSRWFSHGRSLRIPDLEDIGLKITDYSKDPDLNDAVTRYQVLLRMTFEAGPVYKIYETDGETLSRRFQVPALPPEQLVQLLNQNQQVSTAQMEVTCNTCHTKLSIQLDFEKGQPLQPGSIRYPNNDHVPCPGCKRALQLAPARAQLEKQVGRRALTPQPTT
jgi:hypothetical protein